MGSRARSRSVATQTSAARPRATRPPQRRWASASRSSHELSLVFRGLSSGTPFACSSRIMRPLPKIVVLGANGAMGSGSGAVFASAGIPTVFLARSLEKAEAGRARAEQLAKGKVPAKSIAIGTYDSDLAHVVGEAELVFEAVAEDLE